MPTYALQPKMICDEEPPNFRGLFAKLSSASKIIFSLLYAPLGPHEACREAAGKHNWVWDTEIFGLDWKPNK